MNIVDLILNDPKQANAAIADAMQARVFDYLDNYQLAEEELLDEASNTVTKDKNGKITGWKHEGDWEKSKPMTDKQAIKKVKADTEGARKWSEKLTKEDIDDMDQEEFDALVENFAQLDELSKETLGSYIKGANVSKDVARAAVKTGDHSKQTIAKSAGVALKRLSGIKDAKLKLISK